MYYCRDNIYTDGFTNQIEYIVYFINLIDFIFYKYYKTI